MASPRRPVACGHPIYKMEPDSGEVRSEVSVPEPELHGMTLRDGQIWFCCATTRRVRSVDLPA